MQRISLAVVLAVCVAASASAARVASEDITISGCVVKGSGGFLITDVVADTGVSTTIPANSRVLYWLDDDDELEPHAGHKVQVAGKLEADIESGEISIEREQGMVELEAKYRGRKVTAKFAETPIPVGTAGVTDKERDIQYSVRKIDVTSVKKLADSCK